MPRTREQDREYQREYRKRKAADSHLNSVPAERSEAGVASTVADLVQAELKALPQSVTLQASVAAALAMARVLDDPAAVPQHPAAAGQLRQIMAEIRAAKMPEQKSKLAMIRGGRSA